MRFSFLLMGLLVACTVPDRELVGSRCDLTRPDPCGRTLVCHPMTQRCVVDAGSEDGGFDAGAPDAGVDAGATPCTHQPFVTVDEYKPPECQDALGVSLAIYPAPEPWIIVGGFGANCRDAGSAIIERTLHGTQRTTALDQSPPGWQAGFGRISVTPDGGSILAGFELEHLSDGGALRHWRVWRRTVGSTDPLFLIDAPVAVVDEAATGAAVDSLGRLLVAGARGDAVVVRRYDQGNWTDVLVETPMSGCAAYPNGGIVLDRAGNAFLAGQRGGPSCPGSEWFTSVGTNGGTAWDAGRTDSVANASPRTIAVTPNGTVYTVGTSDLREWVVRRGLDAGASWSEIDRWQFAAGQPCTAYGVAATEEGVWVVGGCVDDAGVNGWFVRTLRDGGGWSTDDVYFSSRSSVGAFALGAAVDTRGSVYVTGVASDDAGAQRLVVRRSECR